MPSHEPSRSNIDGYVPILEPIEITLRVRWEVTSATVTSHDLRAIEVLLCTLVEQQVQAAGPRELSHLAGVQLHDTRIRCAVTPIVTTIGSIEIVIGVIGILLMLPPALQAVLSVEQKKRLREWFSKFVDSSAKFAAETVMTLLSKYFGLEKPAVIQLPDRDRCDDKHISMNAIKTVRDNLGPPLPSWLLKFMLDQKTRFGLAHVMYAAGIHEVADEQIMAILNTMVDDGFIVYNADTSEITLTDKAAKMFGEIRDNIRRQRPAT